MSNNNVLIHIGKCGGSSLRKAILSSSRYKDIEIVHIKKPIYKQDFNYYIVARDPIQRCISAFNWRYKLVVEEEKQKNRFANEYEVLKKYENLNNLCEKLYNDNEEPNKESIIEFETIHHLKERISFYLSDFLKVCQKDQIKGVLMQETLAKDLETIFSIPSSVIGSEKRNNVPSKSFLSPKAYQNLVRFLEADYHCLVTLYDYGLIQNDLMKKILHNQNVYGAKK
jgi:hypothetical protein